MDFEETRIEVKPVRQMLKDFCEKNGKPYLLKEWCYEENLPRTPENTSYGSSEAVLWQCELGHQWKAKVYFRTSRETSCPFCSNKQVLPGWNDLATKYPDVAKEWNREKNGVLTPDKVLPGNHKKVWWICEKGHEWNASIKSRTEGCGCPVCANRVIIKGFNDLATTFPEVAAQWDYEKNGSLTPEDVVGGNKKRVWWKCEHGHSWEASISARTNLGSGCPVCCGKKIVTGINDLQTLFPEISAQWDYEKNGKFKPSEISPYTNNAFWWKCPLGHSYKSYLPSRVKKNSGCPYCSGKRVLPGFNDLATTHPDVAKQWHPTLNGDLTPQMVSRGSSRYAWWVCPEGHVWKAVISSRTAKRPCGCPICSGTIKSKKQKKKYQKYY